MPARRSEAKAGENVEIVLRTLSLSRSCLPTGRVAHRSNIVLMFFVYYVAYPDASVWTSVIKKNHLFLLSSL